MLAVDKYVIIEISLSMNEWSVYLGRQFVMKGTRDECATFADEMNKRGL